MCSPNSQFLLFSLFLLLDRVREIKFLRQSATYFFFFFFLKHEYFIHSKEMETESNRIKESDLTQDNNYQIIKIKKNH